MYYTDKIEIYSNEDNVFNHRDHSDIFQERLRLKNILVESHISQSVKKLSPAESEYWSIYRTNQDNVKTAAVLNITNEYGRKLKERCINKLMTLQEFSMRIDKA